MRTEELRIGIKVLHPVYGLGEVRRLAAGQAEILFTEGTKLLCPENSDLSPSEPKVEISGLQEPLDVLVRRTVAAVITELGLEKPESYRDLLARRWQGGKLILKTANDSQPKEIDLDIFFHKIVMMRNQLRILEQKINAHDKLSDAEKVELQSYITRCYGSMTSFNILFHDASADGF